MSDVFFIDWNKDLLFGFQRHCCEEAVQALRQAIRNKEKIEPVVVMHPFGFIPIGGDGTPEGLENGLGEPFNPDHGRTYLLDNMAAMYVSTGNSLEIRRNGGHHRAWAHYLEGKPLACRWRGPMEDTYFDDMPSSPHWKLLWEIPRLTDVRMYDGTPEWDRRRVQHHYKV